MNKLGLALHRIAVGCVLFWGMNLLVHVRSVTFMTITGAMLWLVLAYVLFRWPRKTGIWLGLLMLVVVALQCWALSMVLADPQHTAFLEETSKDQQMASFWISVIPLIVGGLCSLPLRWMPSQPAAV